jgi:nitroreductase
LENAPYLICIFGNPNQPYHKESLWLAAGWMLLASEEMGLSTLTYTPEDMSFLKRLLEVNDPYTPELIIPIGYAQTSEPSMPRKDFSEVVSWVD